MPTPKIELQDTDSPTQELRGDFGAMPDEMVRQALRFGTWGWRVFPCEEHGKKPLVAKWPQRATSDPAEIRALWLTNPSANIGIATGDISGIFVLDVDGQRGADSLLEWDGGGQRLPDTLRAKTGSGWHFYFALPKGVRVRNSVSKLAPGLDVRGQGGYVIAPPSVHESGHKYEFSGPAVTPASPPEWLLQRVVQDDPPSAPRLCSQPHNIPRGRRNDELASCAGTMRKRGFTREAIEAALLKENTHRCQPPLPEQEVQKIAESVSRYAASHNRNESLAPGGLPNSLRRADLLTLASVEAREVEWLFRPYLAIGTLAMLSGDPGAGKTFVALAIAADVTAGRIPHTSEVCPPARVLYLSVENSPEHVLRPRFDSLGGDAGLFDILRGSVTDNDEEPQRGSVRLSDVPLLQDALRRTEARLVIVDPIQSYLGADVDAHRSNETRPVMDGLSRLAEEHRCCILLVRHLGKARTARALYQGLGSIDLTGAVRTELLAGCPPDDPTERALVQVKSNLAQFGMPLGYTIDDDGTFRWTGESHLTAAAILAPESNGEEAGALAKAEGFLFNTLTPGPRPATEVEAEARQEGISERTLTRAKAALRVRSRKPGMTTGWEWFLPEGGQQ